MENKLALKQELYKVENNKVVKHVIIGIYTLEKVKQDRDNYFFNSAFNLIATLSEDNPEYKTFTETGILNTPIEKHSFKPLVETFNLFFLKEKDAVSYLKSLQEQQEKNRQAKLVSEIEELELLLEEKRSEQMQQ